MEEINNQLVLGFKIKEFNKDLKTIQKNLKPLIRLGIIKSDETGLLVDRISEGISKYIITN